MHELEGFFGTQGTERFDHAEAQATASVHCNARRLVDDDQPFIFAHDRVADELKDVVGRAFRGILWLYAHGRNANFVPGLEAPLRPCAAAIYAHLAAAHDAVDSAARYARQ